MKRSRQLLAPVITYCGQRVLLSCDLRCDKAWGRNGRRRDANDQELPDDCLGVAPADPGTREGGEGKPQTISELHNKWCAWECERATLDELE
jgi:hypothetical protein